MLERSEITWGTSKIAYEVRRSPRRSTVSLVVEPGVGLLVTAPEGTSIPKLDALVKTKARWVVERLRRGSDLPPASTAREFVSGETFYYLGRQCRLRLLHDAAPRPLVLRGGWLDLPLPIGLPLDRHGSYARAALTDWYKRLAANNLPIWARPYIEKLGGNRIKVVIADQSRRWGSCSNGVLRFNWRVMQAPRALVEYVLAHEAAHLLHEDHGPNFWATLGRLMPDYETRKMRLKQLGPGLVW